MRGQSIELQLRDNISLFYTLTGLKKNKHLQRSDICQIGVSNSSGKSLQMLCREWHLKDRIQHQNHFARLQNITENPRV